MMLVLCHIKLHNKTWVRGGKEPRIAPPEVRNSRRRIFALGRAVNFRDKTFSTKKTRLRLRSRGFGGSHRLFLSLFPGLCIALDSRPLHPKQHVSSFQKIGGSSHLYR